MSWFSGPSDPKSGSGAASPAASSTPPCPAKESTTSGNRIDVVFDPDKSSKVTKCDKIVHVQFIRMKADGVTQKAGDLWAGWKFRDKITTADGWYVDSLASETTPDYQQGTGDGKKNGGSTKAKITDAPDILNFVPGGFYDPVSNKGGTKKFENEFAVYAWCMKGPDCGKWYEGVKWKYVKTWENHRDGSPGVSTISDNNVTTKPTSSQIKAFNMFNKEHGYKPCT